MRLIVEASELRLRLALLEKNVQIARRAYAPFLANAVRSPTEPPSCPAAPRQSFGTLARGVEVFVVGAVIPCTGSRARIEDRV